MTPVDPGGCAPPVHVLTERQQDQAFIERQREEYRQRADAMTPADRRARVPETKPEDDQL